MKSVKYASGAVEGLRMMHSATAEAKVAPVPPGHLRVKVRFAGLNPVDAKFCIGDKLPEWMKPLSRRLMNEKTVGFDFSGEVVEVGASKRLAEEYQFQQGDEVFGDMPPPMTSSHTGSLAEYVIVPEDQVVRRPDCLSMRDAGCIGLVGLTAVQALKHDYKLQAGQRLLLIGASGGVGHVAVQVAKCLGAEVTAVCSQKNADFVSGLGADRVVDYTQGSAALAKELRGIVAASGPFDLCFDTV
eukprot:CAMPEP_0118936616 /NCGR_PEP_ID=MMETSP1169-20130426/19672_1 /TAXON_ID=36882 /ORGANISM="Pyramimonas obovata, Strain CCMP722" /LENGTH=242 /DNA_ID=CAMNT_0006879929 /DNA_START=35 /DNA_END=760 /DNA_ORIENTATION=+